VANLALAACKRAKMDGCKLLGKKIDWYGIQAPLKGSRVAKVLPHLCPRLLSDASWKNGMDCMRRAGSPTEGPKQVFDIAESWNSLLPRNVPKWVYKTAENEMSGSMCGTFAADYSTGKAADQSAFGMIAKAMANRQFKKLAKSKDYTEGADLEDWKARNKKTTRSTPKYGNDGVVAWSSCAVRATPKYKKDVESKWYAVDGDHDFGTCSSGDNKEYPGQRPCQWIRNMVKKIRKQNRYPAAKPPAKFTAAPAPAPTPAATTTTPAPAVNTQTVNPVPRFQEVAEEEEEEEEEEEGEAEGEAEAEEEGEAEAEGEGEAEGETEGEAEAETEAEAEATDA